MFKYLFSPIAINGLEVKNRIAYPALGLCYSYDSTLNDKYYNYFREKARGGAGIVTVGPVGIDKYGAGIIVLSLSKDEYIPSFRKLTSIIKNEGARAWIQLFHAGAYAYSIALEGERPIAPSAVYSRYSKEMPREMTLEDIKATQKAYVDAALRAREAGFDGIELIASAGYLITQFLSPLKNQRTDEYGGSFENRTRFPREIIEILRKTLGADFPISIRMAGNDFVPGSNTSMETPRIAQVYEKAGIDLINVTGGWHETRVPQLPMELPRGGYAYLALNIKKAVSVPVMASNRIPDPRVAERIISEGMADMINVGRVLIADPYWPKKAQEGKMDEIRPCVACNQGCTDTIFSGKPVFCLANPMAGFEGERRIVKTGSPRNVMVIGAGPGGCEAAVTAALAGHHVEIFEKQDDIGGQLWIAGAPPHKQELRELIRFYKVMISKLGIPVHLNTEISIEDIKSRKPDFVVVAEGASPLMPNISGIKEENVFSAWKVLRDNPPLGRKVAVIGGGAVGLETALYVAAMGTIGAETLQFLVANEAENFERLKELMFRGSKEVTVFEMQNRIGNDIGKSTRWIIRQNLDRYGVKAVTGAKVISMNGGEVAFEKDGMQERMAFDSIIVALGSRSVRILSEQIVREGIPCRPVGDCVRPAKISDAVHEGFLAALEIDRIPVGA